MQCVDNGTFVSDPGVIGEPKGGEAGKIGAGDVGERVEWGEAEKANGNRVSWEDSEEN